MCLRSNLSPLRVPERTLRWVNHAGGGFEARNALFKGYVTFVIDARNGYKSHKDLNACYMAHSH